jgi:hypothetical protein
MYIHLRVQIAEPVMEMTQIIYIQYLIYQASSSAKQKIQSSAYSPA